MRWWSGSNKATLLLAAVFGVVVFGSGVLKTRHMVSITDRMRWQPEGFDLGRAQFDRLTFEARRPQLERDSRAVREFDAGILRYLHGEDRDALAHFVRAGASEPDWPLLRFYLGATRLHLGHAISAAADLELAAERGFDPPESTARWWWAMAELYAGNFTEGRTLLGGVADSDTPQAEMARLILDRLETGPPQEKR